MGHVCTENCYTNAAAGGGGGGAAAAAAVVVVVVVVVVVAAKGGPPVTPLTRRGSLPKFSRAQRSSSGSTRSDPRRARREEEWRCRRGTTRRRRRARGRSRARPIRRRGIGTEEREKRVLTKLTRKGEAAAAAAEQRTEHGTERREARGSCIRRNKHKQERQVEKKKRANGKEMGGVP